MIHNHVKLHGHKPVKPTPRMLRYWWGRLNVEVFDGALHLCQLTVLDEPGMEDASGVCYPLDCGRVRINVSPTHADSRAAMLGTLAHEMVHQYQHQHDQAMHHGTTFEQWRSPILGLTGLTI